MGCTLCRKEQEVVVVINRAHRNPYKDLFYASGEFDLSRSDSEDEAEGNVLQSSEQPVILSLNEQTTSTNNENIQTVVER
jgi:hypothetical protein